MDRTRLHQLKDEYWNIYQSEILGYTFIWREVSRAEFKRIVRYFTDPYDQEDEICKLCLIEPAEFDFESCEAGVATMLADHIIKESGFSSEPTGKISETLNMYRNELGDFQNQVSCIIHEAFPTLDIEEIEDWNLEKTLWYFSRAEYKLSLRGITLKNTSGEEEKQNTLPTQNGLSGNVGDFPEGRAQKAFMEGKLR